MKDKTKLQKWKTVQKYLIIVVAYRTFKTWQSSLNKSLYDLLFCFTLKMCSTVMILEFKFEVQNSLK